MSYKSNSYLGIVELIRVLGWTLDFENHGERKSRWDTEDTFIDLWDGKRGITLGVYDPDSKRMLYHRRVTAMTIEQYLPKP